VGIDHGRASPEDGNVIPCVGCRDDRYVHKARGRRMAEVERGEVEEVDDEQQLSKPESTSDPEHDKAEDEKIVLIIIS